MKTWFDDHPNMVVYQPATLGHELQIQTDMQTNDVFVSDALSQGLIAGARAEQSLQRLGRESG